MPTELTEQTPLQQAEDTATPNKTTAHRFSICHPLRSAKRAVVVAAALVVVGALCWMLGGISARKSESPTTEISAVVLQAQLETVSELATVSYHYTNMGQFENSNEFYGVKLPFTTKSFILTYDGCIKAGVDLTGAKIECEAHNVSVTLPAAKILSHEMQEDSLEVFDEKTSIFNPFTVEDYNGFQQDQKKIMEEKALAGGLLEQAQTRAAETVRSLLAPLLPPETALTIA